MTERERNGLGDGVWGDSASWVSDRAWGAPAS